jgi:hypothetical protein
MNPLMKLLPLLTIGYLGYLNSDLLDKGMAMINSVQNDATVNIEFSNMARGLRAYYVETNTLPFNNFSQWLEENMTQEGGRKTRDKTKDMWGTSYKLEPRPNGFAILSAGPDRKWGTPDDLCGAYSLEELGGEGQTGSSPPPVEGNQSPSSPQPASSSQPTPPKFQKYEWRRK